MSNEESHDLDQELYDRLFRVRTSIRYHVHRSGFYGRLHRTAMFFAVLVSSANAGLFLGAVELDWLQLALLLLVSGLAAIDLVFECPQMANRHTDLRRRFSEVESRLSTEKPTTDRLLGETLAKILEIEAMEPPQLMVLATICHNELILAEGRDKEDGIKCLPVAWYQAIFAQLIDIAPQSCCHRGAKPEKA